MFEGKLAKNWLSRTTGGELGNQRDFSNSFLIVLALNFLVFAGALFGFCLQYQTNDDVAMNLYASGHGLGSAPSEFLLFQHFIVGLSLKFLYLHFPQVPWYGALMYTYLFLSSLTLGYVISRLSPHFSPVWQWIAVFLLFYLEVIVSPQFTIVSGYLAIAGTALLYCILYKPNSSVRLNRSLAVMAFGLLILAGLVRFYSLMLSLLLMTPLFVYLLGNHFSASWRRLLPIVGCVVLVSGLCNWGQQWYYARSPGWEGFYSYNNVRADFMDRHKITWDKGSEPFFRQIGWSNNDLAMLVSWFYLDPSVYSLQNLLFVSQHTSLLPRPEIVWSKLFSDLTKSFSSSAGLATLFVCVLVLTLGAGLTRVFAILGVLWYAALFAGISIVERHLPLRVWSVMLFGLYVTELMLWCHVWEKRNARLTLSGPQRVIIRVLQAILAPAFYFVCCWNQISVVGQVSNAHRRAQDRFREDLARLQPQANQLFVSWGGDFPYELFQLPTQPAPVTSKMQLLGLGVGNHEPFVQNRLKSLGIDDLYSAFYTRENIFLVCRGQKASLLVRYIQEHYQTKVQVETIFRGKTFTISKVQKVI